jgi:EAL domain-containing protein (putative c-di-GMP-specific phosphodiesterase class I)
VEALARWQHPDGRLVSPAQFVPLAEQTGLIKPLTLWALQEALRQQVAWRKEGLDISVAVNLSTRNLLDASLPDRLADFLAVTGTETAKLCLEITESVVMADPVKSLAHLARLHRMGVRLAVDDFGTGYSSFAYLKRLPVHELKIDKAFVSGLMKDRNDATIVRVATDLGRNLGLKVVAEGVEDQQTLHGLVALGCHEAQGFLISPALPNGELMQWLQNPPSLVTRL